MSSKPDAAADQAVYTPFTLAAYDAFVLGLSNTALWRCPTRHLRELYDGNVRANHLDVGVGTGYFLDNAKWPIANPTITLIDLNPNSLSAAAKRIARYAPRTVSANVLDPLPGNGALAGTFDSIGLCYLLHCLPGTMREKAIVFDRLMPLMSPGARIFGATILQGDAPRSAPARALLAFYNRKGIFSNADDTFDDLENALKERFTDIRLERFGAVATFEASRPS